jgi:hypothetical protein
MTPNDKAALYAPRNKYWIELAILEMVLYLMTLVFLLVYIENPPNIKLNIPSSWAKIK